MTIFAVGDIQGCYDELRTLLDIIQFDRGKDRLWLTGDLVNRGGQSVEVLRFVMGLGDAAVTVLGNHDLHLLAIAGGAGNQRRGKDTLDSVLLAHDREELLHWLRHRPVLYRANGLTLIHAGLPPQWDLAQAQRCAQELETTLRGPDHPAYFRRMYGDTPDMWAPGLERWDKLRFITNCLTRLRYCHPDGRLALKEKAPLGRQKSGNLPWFAVPGRRSRGDTIVFGHWSTLQLNGRVDASHRILPLDNGCVWGGRLTAVRLPEGHYVDHPCHGWQRPRDLRIHRTRIRGRE